MDNEKNNLTAPSPASGPRKKSRKAARRRRKVITRSVIGVLVVALVGVGIYYMSRPAASTSTTSYSVQQVTSGDLKETITGTGALAFKDTVSVELPTGVTIADQVVPIGGSVKQGDVIATLDTDSIQKNIDSLNTEISTAQRSVSSSNGDTLSSSIKSLVEGRVKTIYAKEGDDIQNVMQQHGALMILSTDGLMKTVIKVESTDGLTLNQSLTVTLSDGSTLTGTLSAINTATKEITVLMDDEDAPVNDTVTVKTDKGVQLGSGTLSINHPLKVTGTGGTVEDCNVSENSSVSKNTTLYTLTDLPITDTYITNINSYNDLNAQLVDLEKCAANPVITAPTDGIVTALDEAGTTFTLATRKNIQMDVSVDELDILKVKPDMDVTITLDSLPDETFTGKVTAISSSGNTQNSVTTYPVTVTLNDDPRFLPGMNATAEVVVEAHDNVLMVPVEAINTSQGKSFVYLYTGSLPTDSSASPGTYTSVETGLSNDQYVEIVSGLKEGDSVVVVRSASSSTNNMNFTFGGGMGGLGAVTGEKIPGAGMAQARRNAN